MAGLIRGAPRTAGVTGKIVFIRAVRTITPPIVETENIDSTIAEWASEEDVETWSIAHRGQMMVGDLGMVPSHLWG